MADSWYNEVNKRTGPSGAVNTIPTPDRTPAITRSRLLMKYRTSPTFANIGCYGLPRSEVH
jgi:hypothetical protein